MQEIKNSVLIAFVVLLGLSLYFKNMELFFFSFFSFIILFFIIYAMKKVYIFLINSKFALFRGLARLLFFFWVILILVSIISGIPYMQEYKPEDIFMSASFLMALVLGAIPISINIPLKLNFKRQRHVNISQKEEPFKGYIEKHQEEIEEFQLPEKASSFLDYLQKMDPYDFEKLVAEVLKARFGENADVILTQSSRDKGVDVIINLKDEILGGKYLVQVKRYKNNVGEPELKQFLGTIHDHRAKGIFVTLSDFTEPAKKLAKEHNITLINGEKLIEMVKRYKIIELPEASTFDNYPLSDNL